MNVKNSAIYVNIRYYKWLFIVLLFVCSIKKLIKFEFVQLVRINRNFFEVLFCKF